jgi:hypothetical protein
MTRQALRVTALLSTCPPTRLVPRPMFSDRHDPPDARRGVYPAGRRSTPPSPEKVLAYYKAAEATKPEPAPEPMSAAESWRVLLVWFAIGFNVTAAVVGLLMLTHRI